ncbi:hypothetical protein CDES_03085 [Corynebacterium deserti GIMN1.010]|uniref:Uncharacterized protein n=1 Tax=Corynebacterium deserti GIMN1.010 TaxID=931089 RepID=A0A0M4CWC7_9CORY|nr:hypothetical protein [Corynebacterium deserti]ALC05070.1 hypothetical protein CDES_03085 [Corynebacterium deserti GIMN1.010]
MTHGFLVNPDLTNRAIEFELEDVAKFLGGTVNGRVAVAFQEEGDLYAALYSAEAKEEGAAANPVASLGRNSAATGNAAFFSDPSTAVCGPVVFVGAEGDDITQEEIDRIQDGIRAARNYRDDYPEEFQLWQNAVYNLRKQ